MKAFYPRVGVVLLIGTATLACSATPAHVQSPRSAEDYVSTTTTSSAALDRTPALSAGATDQVLSLGPNIRVACKVDDGPRPPRFDYDESRLSSNDRALVSSVADCFTKGPLRGRFVSVVARRIQAGHADAWGEPGSGQKRALAVKSALVGLGVDAAHITDVAPGDISANETRRLERRVDLELAN